MEVLEGWPPSVSSAGYIFLSDASFLIERLLLAAEVPCA